MTKILVTGGAGYIGSHVVHLLARRNFLPIVYDNFSTGFRDFVEEFDVIEGDIGDYQHVSEVLKSHDITCVMNFASYIAVGESVNKPLMYYDNNVAKTFTMFRAMLDAGVKRFIFSSSAAVYGTPEEVPISEDSRLHPESPYGKTKYFIEEVLRDLDISDQFKSVSLRYFNAAGADFSGQMGEGHVPETHLIPLVIRAVLDPEYTITIFGTDYDTEDGTCVRDYIHVNDLAMAHILALENLMKTPETRVYNLGNGLGFSVKEVIDSVKRVTGKDLSVKEGKRRPGDPAILVASASRAREELGWDPQYPEIDEIVRSAWNWESQQRRRGY